VAAADRRTIDRPEAHLTRIGDRFTPYAEGRVTLTLTVDNVAGKAAADGPARVITVPSTALVRDGAAHRVYVQRTPERFDFREVTTHRTLGDYVEITSGLRETDRVVVRGAERMPRP
jgi:hypothetical protein